MSAKRLYELDGLRGLAAMWVVLYHFWTAIQQRDVSWVPAWVVDIFKAGFLGVDVFFVLSGFVIMHSVSSLQKGASSSFVPRFLLRRSVRIDPPYWGAIVLAILLMALKGEFFPDSAVTLPSVSTVLAHFVYLQDLLQLQPISSVFWTLCIEFQFYFLFSLIFLVYSRLDLSTRYRWRKVLIFLAIFMCLSSPILRFSSFGFPIPGTIFPYVYEFIIGVVTYFWVKDQLSGAVVAAVLLISSSVTLYFMPIQYAIIPLFVVAILWLSSKDDGLSLMRSKVMLFLGQISYSLYLIHASIGWVAISLMLHFSEGFDGRSLTIIIFLVGILFSIFFAWLFFKLIERPSQLYSKKIKVH